ncbi:MAG: hypothetical protein KDK89_04255 [Alphaproteobacteria bacterium]|nr:hypothetical protein [Alphaproteobacteria bacterium]
MLHRFLLALSFIVACAATASAQERQWSLDAGGEDAYLVFGVPDSDDVGISLWCPVQSGEINIFLPETSATLEAGKDVPVVIKAGEEMAELTGTTEANEDAGAVSVEVHAAADLPVFSAMLQADRFRLIVAGDEQIFPLVDADFPDLLDICRKP